MVVVIGHGFVLCLIALPAAPLAASTVQRRSELSPTVSHDACDPLPFSCLSHAHEPGVSTEAVLRVSYQPLAVFRVRPVTRCTSTMPGHTEAVLHVSYSADGSMLASGGGDMTVR